MSELDCSTALQPCNCTANQVCIQIGRSSTECAKNTCVDKGSSGGKGGGGGSSVGAVAGQAVGGVVGGLIIIVAVYWFWWRKRRAGGVSLSPAKHGGSSFFTKGASGAESARGSNALNGSNNNGLKNLKMGGGKNSPNGIDEKYSPHSKAPAPSPLRNVTSPIIEEDEEDLEPSGDVIKRQSLRFDSGNNGTHTSKRSLSNNGINASMTENPFGDQYSEARNSKLSRHGNGDDHHEDGSDDGTERGERDSTAASLSDFSFRSSRTNIIPIAYIPAHSSQASTIDMTNSRRDTNASGHRPQSSFTLGGGRINGTEARDSSGLPLRGNRASVPLSLRSSSTSDIHDSMSGATFSRLFDRRASSNLPAFNNSENRSTLSSGGALEIIAPNMGATSPPLLTTPTMTKDGRPIRPPRAPGLDLKLPTPESISPSPTSPGFPWNSSSNNNINSPSTATSLNLSPGNSNNKGGAQSQFAIISPTLSLSNGNNGTGSGRETLLSPTFPKHNGRSSAYSTFSQSTDASGSHMSYILEAPQIVTPVSAGGVQVQTLSRAAARAVILPHSNSGNSLNVTAGGGASTSAGSSPLARRQASSPLSDNPFDDDAAVRIAIPSSQNSTPTLPLTPTFGGNPPLPGSGDHTSSSNAMRASVSTADTRTRRDSDLSIFTSSDAQREDEEDNTGTGKVGPKRTARNSFASSFASSSHAGGSGSSTRHSNQQMRAPSPSSYVGTTGHSTSSGKSIAGQSIVSDSAAQVAEDEVILSPPRRPFVTSSDSHNSDGGYHVDSRHTSAAMSMRSGYGSVLDGIPFNLSLGNDHSRNSQASDTGSTATGFGAGSHVSVPFHFGSGVPLAGRNISSMAMSSSEAGAGAGVRDSSATFRTSVASSAAIGYSNANGNGKRDTSYSVASSSAHLGGGRNDKRDTSYSLASEWNGAFAGMPIQMGGIAEEAVPELPSMYAQESNTEDNTASTSASGTGGVEEEPQDTGERPSSDGLAMAAAVARQFGGATE